MAMYGNFIPVGGATPAMQPTYGATRAAYVQPANVYATGASPVQYATSVTSQQWGTPAVYSSPPPQTIIRPQTYAPASPPPQTIIRPQTYAPASSPPQTIIRPQAYASATSPPIATFSPHNANPVTYTSPQSGFVGGGGGSVQAPSEFQQSAMLLSDTRVGNSKPKPTPKWSQGNRFTTMPGNRDPPPPRNVRQPRRWQHSPFAVSVADMALWQTGRHGRWVDQLQQQLEAREEAARAKAEAEQEQREAEQREREAALAPPPEQIEAPPTGAEEPTTADGEASAAPAEPPAEEASAAAGLIELELNEFQGDVAAEIEKEKKPIKSISIMKNNLPRVPDIVLGLKSLRELNFEENQIESINPVCNAMPQLELLNCSDNPISTLGNIAKLTKLHTLYAYKLKVKEIPSALFTDCTSITDLNMYNNQIASLPASIQNLKDLKELNLASNKLISLPAGCLDGLSRLRRIALFWNAITTLPSLKDLEALEELQLNSNSLQTFPEMGEHPELTMVSFNKNRLQEIPDNVLSGTAMPSLDELNLGSNQLMFVPDSIGTLTTLTKLILSSNKLSMLPVAVYALPNLIFLDIGSNRFEHVPEDIAGLSKLVTLFFASNEMRTVPSAIATFPNLRRFSIRQNPIDKKHVSTAATLKAVEATCEKNGGMYIS
eukprot:NODE_148_length_2187_cov_170.870907_g121_i0.p1 GENE.NODE_148_length_2187_cov_170.870907_g121_i0~~NODE_148_length_2187_cov_170.870907_g121_i0.p1  ORF type:complete len:661 (-),score=172.15 NODE_148_length_2187_cov_170.870907_g121_i0:139-2121(-)